MVLDSVLIPERRREVDIAVPLRDLICGIRKQLESGLLR
jgi:hypothetical protein